MRAASQVKRSKRKAKFLGPIRLDEELLDQINKLAERNERTVAGEVRLALRRHLETEGGQT